MILEDAETCLSKCDDKCLYSVPFKHMAVASKLL